MSFLFLTIFLCMHACTRPCLQREKSRVGGVEREREREGRRVVISDSSRTFFSLLTGAISLCFSQIV
jgi:hypothetical protein